MAVYSANVTKVRAGGSGDNYVSDGFIKTVEKVWIDSYEVAAAITTGSSVVIAKVPANKKITDIIIHMPAVSPAGTDATVYITTGQTIATTTFLGAAQLSGQATSFPASTKATLRLAAEYIGTVAPKDVDISLVIQSVGGLGVEVTGGTIRTIVKYT